MKDQKSAKSNSTSGGGGGSSIEVCLFEGWYENSPRCLHGPMLLFERYTKDKVVPRRFFACSASRQKNSCKNIWEDEYHQYQHEDDNVKANRSKLAVKTLPSFADVAGSSYRTFCYTCQMFVLSSAEMENRHKSCNNCKRNVTLQDMKQPSKLFISPIENNKSNAQYFMTAQSISFMRSALLKLNFRHFICIGVPRFHEIICSESDTTKSSFLLDIDDRYAMFWPDSHHAKFNMFNHYFFESTGLEKFSEFIKSTGDGKIAILMDPPFGGLVDCLCETIRWISETAESLKGESNCFTINKVLPSFWIFPYFHEGRICSNFKDFNMLNYVVDYDNHKKFKNAEAGRKMSPVRIFTNIANHFIPLPAKQGYKFCSKCKRYVAKKEVHCKLCNNCPSKDGSLYWHCRVCRTCVKPGRKHCFTCKRCELPTHQCKPQFEGNSCHICGEKGHRRIDCPKRLISMPLSLTPSRHPEPGQNPVLPISEETPVVETPVIPILEETSVIDTSSAPLLLLNDANTYNYFHKFMIRRTTNPNFRSILKRKGTRKTHSTICKKQYKCKWLALASHQKTLAAFQLDTY